MHAVVRLYSGAGAKALFEMIETRKSEIEDVMSSVAGFKSYTLIRTADGGASVTVCEDKKGADESVKTAREWIVANASDLNIAAPTLAEGEVIIAIG